MTRFVRSICAAVALLASAASALGQSSILQGGAWTPGHSPMYVGQGQSQPIVQDSGPAGGGGIGLGLSEQLLSVRSPTGTYPAVNAGSGPLFTNWCDYDGPITGPYHYLCIGPNASGGGLIAYGFGGGATALPFSFNINGTATQLPAAGSGGTFVTVVIPTTSGAPVCFSGTVGLVTACPGITNAQLATVPAATFKGNPTATANVAPIDFTIAGLTARGAPDANNDKLVLLNNATGAFNYVTPGQIATAATAGVSSLCSLTGALTATQVTACLNLFSSSLQGLVPASGGGTTNFLRADGAFAAVVGSVCGQTGTITAAQIISNCGIAWSNTRLAKTSAYTATTSDCASTLALGGNAYYPVTFDAASGYAAACALYVLNEDSLAAKLILPQFATSTTTTNVNTGSKAFTTASNLTFNSVLRYRIYSLANHANFMSGTASYSGTTLTLTVDLIGGSGSFSDWQIAPEIFLWPNTTRVIYAQNGVWQIDNQWARWKAPVNTQMYMDAINGHDYNDCLASSRPCLTFNWTLRTLTKDYFDLTGQTNFSAGLLSGVANLVVNLADNATSAGTCTTCYGGAHLDFITIGYEGRASIVIRGDVANPQNVVISDPGGALPNLPNNIDVYSPGINLQLDSLQVGQSSCSSSPKTPGANVQANDGAIIRFERQVFIGCAGGTQISATSNGAVNDDNGVTIIGGGTALAVASDRGEVALAGQIVTCVGAPAYSSATLVASRLGEINVQSTVWTSCGSVTGTRFSASELSLITTGTGNPNGTIPGNVNGTIPATGTSLVD